MSAQCAASRYTIYMYSTPELLTSKIKALYSFICESVIFISRLLQCTRLPHCLMASLVEHVQMQIFFFVFSIRFVGQANKIGFIYITRKLSANLEFGNIRFPPLCLADLIFIQSCRVCRSYCYESELYTVHLCL